VKANIPINITRDLNLMRQPRLDKLCALALYAGLIANAMAQTPADVPAAANLSACKLPEVNRRFLVLPASVEVLVQVDEQGVATGAQSSVEPPNAEISAAATSAAMACQYRPAVAAGKPAAGTARLVYAVAPERSLLALLPAATPASAAAVQPAIANVRNCAPTADDYPVESRQLNETGTTRVNFTIGPEGQLLAFGVAKSSGFLRLDFTALIKLAGCQFKPGRAADGTATGGSFIVDYVWKLE